ncbi:permease prefix domain 1-containing protein [Anaerolentibacter hominis]|uniref:permease prefix domain 1-containing protein n=1 Tax=Anaerolentibacter hominis TaxID=3079009 RepID=UPI0031B88A97
MGEKMGDYLDTAAGQIRWKRVRPAIMTELRTHILEQKDAYTGQGMEEKEAETKALKEMGDPVSLGQELDRIHRPAPQWGLLVLTAFLTLSGGLLRMWLTADTAAYDPGKTIALLTAGFSFMLLFYFLDYTVLGQYARFIYLGTVILGAVTLVMSPSVNGILYYTGYLVFLFPLVYALLVYSLRGTGWSGLILALAGAVPLLAIASIAPSILGVLLMLLITVILLLSAVQRQWFKVPKGWGSGLVTALTAIGTAWFFLPRWQEIAGRIKLALYPALDYNGRGYQASVIREALAGAKLWGQGTIGGAGAAGSYKGIIPDAETDFLFATLIHQKGWIPFLILCAGLIGLIVWAGVKCRRQANDLGRMVSVAIILSIGVQTAVSLAMNLGFVLFRASCPFVMGNLQTVVNMVLMGVLLSVFRQEKVPARYKIVTISSIRGKLVS